MRKNKGRELQQLQFGKDHLDDLIKVAIRNDGKEGFVQCFVTTDFKLQSIPTFIGGKFDKKKFIQLESLKMKNPEGKKIDTCYLRILWSDNNTVWEIKQEYEVYSVPTEGLPGSESLN